MPGSQLRTVSFQTYREFIAAHKLSQDAGQTQLVKKVGKRVQEAVESYFQEQGMAGELAGYEWEFNLIEDPTVNAWCMPGGKAAVYTGMMPIAKDEPGLAVVIAHEIAHAVAEHVNERLSHEMLIRLGTTALGEALEEHPEQTRRLLLTAAGLGTEVGLVLPYSRMHESEADRLGLIFMAMAGYDPKAAVDFWERMLAVEKSQGRPPVFLSTHPSGPQRIGKIKEWIPEAMRYYRGQQEGCKQ